MRKLTAMLGLALLLGLGLSLWIDRLPEQLTATGAALGIEAERCTERVVFLGGNLADEQRLLFTTALAASGHPGIVLLDTPRSSDSLRTFLAAYLPQHIVPVGSFGKGRTELQARLGQATGPVIEWKRGPPAALWNQFFPDAERVVVSPAQPRGLVLHAACLAGAVRAPLFLIHDEHEAKTLPRQLAAWKTRQVFAAGTAMASCRDLPGITTVALADEEAVAAAYLRQQQLKLPVGALVLANPADTHGGLGGLSSLAPWLALRHRAALLLTDATGNNATAVVRAALKKPELARADTLIIVGGLQAIPMERRPNPVTGKDAFIEMEPFTPVDQEPFTLATGRLFHEDPGVLTLMLARERLLAGAPRPRRALVVSNTGGSLPLLETFSHHTVKEIGNHGYQVTALFGRDANKEKLRRLLPAQDIFMWEGHYRTMVDEYQLPHWTEPVQPALVFLQSCLALNEAEAQPLLTRGAYAVIGSSTRNYSGSGGAFSLAFFNALLYDDLTVGAALRQAKNFLLVYSLLKEKRLGTDARLQGANLRSAWAFSLWGDPTVKLPALERPSNALPPVRHEVRGQTIVLSLPEAKYDKVSTSKYEAEMWPNARLAGLLNWNEDEDSRRLVPLLFAEVHFPGAPPQQTPQLHSRLPERNWVFCWDARRRSGYLLVKPRSRDKRELRFSVKWTAPGSLNRQAASPFAVPARGLE